MELLGFFFLYSLVFIIKIDYFGMANGGFSVTNILKIVQRGFGKVVLQLTQQFNKIKWE